MKRKNEYLPIVSLVEKFIWESQRGKRLQKNGAIISATTIQNYKSLLVNLKKFEENSQKQWLFNIRYTYTKLGFLKEKQHYKNFYLKFTGFLYSIGQVDNTVGAHIKVLRTAILYSITSKGYEMGLFYKDFYARKEDIPVIVLNQHQLKFLIHDKEFEGKLSKNLKVIKDIFVIGCAIRLRFSDLLGLRKINIERIGESIYIVNKSKKTNTFTRIKIPQYVEVILKKYRGKQKSLLPPITLVNFNKNLKKIALLAEWTDETGKIRSKRGVRKDIKRQKAQSIVFATIFRAMLCEELLLPRC